jgi:hypothetical protein
MKRVNTDILVTVTNDDKDNKSHVPTQSIRATRLSGKENTEESESLVPWNRVKLPGNRI